MRALLTTIVLLAGPALASAEPPPPKTFYVSPSGADQWSGSLPEPNAEKSDGPFATLERARDAIRELKKQGPLPSGGIVVEFRGGVYEREKAFELTGDDSGAEGSPIVYQGRAGEEVRITGGRRVAGFQPVTDPAVLARLDESARGKVLWADLRTQGIVDLGEVNQNRLELFFRDKPMTLARWPNEGFVSIVGLVGGDPVDVRGTKGDKNGKFMYDGDRPSRWKDEGEIWVHGYWFWDWSDQRHKVESIDTEMRIIAVAPPYHHYGYRKGQWFYAFNLLSEIDSPGEWYLDRQTGILYFWPPEPLEPNSVVVSVARDLVRLRDASHVSFRNLIFEGARDTAVTIQGGTQNQVIGCTLRNLGSGAVRFSGGTDSGVSGCEIYGLGSGAVTLWGGDRKTLTPARLSAENNHIHDYGRWNRMYCPAVALGGVGNRAAHNLIHDAPHQAISFGGNEHLIELNEIHHVCLESNDAGAIYAGRDWTQRGTVIRHNYMHHVTGFRGHGCVGVYLDDMFSGTTIAGNVFYQVTRAAFIGGGRDNVIENNLFVDCTPAVHIDARGMGWANYCVHDEMRKNLLAMPYQNDLWRSRYPKLTDVWEDEPAAPKGNLVARNACQGGRWDGFEKRAVPYVTFEDNLAMDDLGLIDPAKMNFQLRDDSPVCQKIPGFQRIPFEQMGLKRGGQ